MKYSELVFKVPQESASYAQDSACVLQRILGILADKRKSGENKIIISTNLKRGLPLGNINKIAGPIIEEWAGEMFESVAGASGPYSLVNVEAQERLDMADLILQFKRDGGVLTANVDVKATSDDIPNSGKSPNITSFARIRTAYVEDPDYMFIVLSFRHHVYPEKRKGSPFTDMIMEVVDFHAYDLKYISAGDLSYNPALGTGQLQIKDIHYVTTVQRNTWEMCRMLDEKYLASSKRDLAQFVELAKRYKWIKE